MIAYAIYSLAELTRGSADPFENKIQKLQKAIEINLI